MRLIIITVCFLLSSAIFAKDIPSVLVQNISSNEIVISSNSDLVRPMASITKLMTAMIALDHYSLDQKIKIGKQSSATVEQLLTNVLVRSDNAASETLAKNYPKGRKAFIEAMNSKARQLGLKVTQFRDPSGLDSGNVTNAIELAVIVTKAGQYPFIKQTSTLVEITKTKKIKNKIQTISLPNTNKDILFEYDNILVSKTGTTSKAGKCLAMLVDNQGQQYAIIILGEPNKQSRDRIARDLIQASGSQKD